MDYNQEALKVHEQYKGKLRVECPAPLDTRDDLSVAYTPGVAEPCRKIAANEEEVYRYTTKGHMVAVVTDGTAVLGLGDIGPEGGAACDGGQGGAVQATLAGWTRCRSAWIPRTGGNHRDGAAHCACVRRHQSGGYLLAAVL